MLSAIKTLFSIKVSLVRDAIMHGIVLMVLLNTAAGSAPSGPRSNSPVSD